MPIQQDDPEPATFLILGTGLIALRYLPRRMRRSQISASAINPQLLTGLHKEIKFNVRTSVQSHAARDTCAYGSTPHGMVAASAPLVADAYVVADWLQTT